jgi:L-malate glycosyltransferase
VISFSGHGRYPNGVRQYRVPGASVRLRRLMLAWLFWRIRPNLVHVHWAYFAADVASVCRVPILVTAWGSDIYRRAEQSVRVVEQLRLGLRAAHAITCDSRDLAREIGEFSGVPPSQISVIQWGVDTEAFHHVTDNAFARELGIEGRQVIFSARNFLPIYNQETIVAAFARVRSQCPQVVLLMKNYGGSSDYVKKILNQVASLGLADAVRVVETVPHERMAELYSLSAVTVSVPLSDATPMALFEAMACGSVPVFSDLPSLREWVDKGENGYLVSIHDDARLAECILLVLRDPVGAAKMAARNRLLIEAEASQSANMMRMEGICRALIGESSEFASSARRDR